jgi:mersacidin/lichenicidin family type 2 lantibiotic
MPSIRTINITYLEKCMIIDIARAWKDAEYRKTLTPNELKLVPPNPVGLAELSSEELAQVSGAALWVTMSGTVRADCCVTK